ncbi:MAG: tandem-95 repeat protein, partial [Pseudomonadales bacterium]
IDDGSPIAVADSATTDEDTPVTTGNVLANDTLTDHAYLSAFDAVSVSGGAVVDNGDGTFTYTPTADFNGTDTFTYTLTDDDGETSTATVTITVNAVDDGPPVATADSATTNEDTPVTTGNVLTNDTLTDHAAISAFDAVSANGGAVVNNGDGTFTYTPLANFNGTDTFTYTLTDDEGQSSMANVSIDVLPVNDTPTTTGVAALSVQEDAEDSVLDIASAFQDLETASANLSYSVTNNTNVSIFSNVSVNADNTLTLGYAIDANGVSQITLRATDVGGAYVETTFTISVSPQNDAPTLQQNTGLTMTDGIGSLITSNHLQVSDVDDSASSTVYTLSSLNFSGSLLLNGTSLAAGDTFTQDDLNNNRLSVSTDGSGTAALMSFTFDVSDASGASIGAYDFIITIQPPVSELSVQPPQSIPEVPASDVETKQETESTVPTAEPVLQADEIDTTTQVQAPIPDTNVEAFAT